MYMSSDEYTIKHTISKPPMNVLFNTSLISKKGIWNISITYLLEHLISILESMNRKDLRLCGIAVLSSSIIFRVKVESIFILEKIADESRRKVDDVRRVDVKPLLGMPYRHEATYDVTLDDLLEILEDIVKRFDTSSKSSMSIEPIEYDSAHLIDLESIIGDYKSRLYEEVRERKSMLFSKFTYTLDPIDTARYFMAMLHLCMESKIGIEQSNDDDILLTSLNQ